MNQGSPHTVTSLAHDLESLGLAAGDVVIMHSSMRSLGYVAGGAGAVVHALVKVLGPEGTLVVPAHVSDNSDPAEWCNPPVPESWWPVIRSETPGFDPARTPSRWMGVLAECVRTWPGTLRSNHPHVSFAALGKHAEHIVSEHPLEEGFGEASPLGKIYALGGKVLLVGCGHGNNTSLHLSETRQENAPRHTVGASVMNDNGTSRWVTWTEVDPDGDDFVQLGEAFEETGAVAVGKVGQSEARLMDQRQLVDFGTAWLAEHRVVAG